MAFTLKLSTAKFRLVFNIRKIKCAECGTKVPFLRKKKLVQLGHTERLYSISKN